MVGFARCFRKTHLPMPFEKQPLIFTQQVDRDKISKLAVWADNDRVIQGQMQGGELKLLTSLIGHNQIYKKQHRTIKKENVKAKMASLEELLMTADQQNTTMEKRRIRCTYGDKTVLLEIGCLSNPWSYGGQKNAIFLYPDDDKKTRSEYVCTRGAITLD